MRHSRPKHVQKINKRTKKNCAQSWLYIQDYTGTHGQQNIKNYTVWFEKTPTNRTLWIKGKNSLGPPLFSEADPDT
jgi:hypothetical protein